MSAAESSSSRVVTAAKRSSSSLSQAQLSGRQHSVSGGGVADASGSIGADGSGVFDQSSATATAHAECDELRAELIRVESRHAAAMQAVTSDSARRIDDVKRDAARQISAATRDARSAQKRIVELSATVASLQKKQLGDAAADRRRSGSPVEDGPASPGHRLRRRDSAGVAFPATSGSRDDMAAAVSSRSTSARDPPPGAASSTGALDLAATSAEALRGVVATRDEAVARLEASLNAAEQREAALRQERDELQCSLDAAVRDVRQLQDNAAAATTSGTPAASSSPPRDLQKRLATLSTELAKSREERDSAKRRAFTAEAELSTARNKLFSSESTLAALKRSLESSERQVLSGSQMLDRHASAYDELTLTKAELTRLQATHSECERREAHFAQFRATHDRCSEALIEQRARIFTLEGSLQRSEKACIDAQKTAQLAQSTADESRRKLAAAADASESLKKKAAADVAAAKADAAQKQQVLETLRRKLDDESRRAEEYTAAADRLQRVADEQRETLAALSGAKSTAETELESARGAGAELHKLRAHSNQLEIDVARLRSDLSDATQACRRLESDKATADKEHGERLYTLQRTNLELLETRQMLESRDRDMRRIRDERDAMVARLNDMEGSHTEGTATTSRRLTGLLESMTPELAQQVAEYLRLEFMRGGTKTAALFRKVFNLDTETSKEVVDALSHLYLMVRTESDSEAMCRLLGVKEITVRRIVAGFTTVMQKYSPTPRRRQLTANRGPDGRRVLRGRDRLLFLVACEAAPTLRSLSSTCDGGNTDVTMIRAKICSFLIPTLVGNTSFATHTRTDDEAKTGKSVLLRLDLDAGTFAMHEARISPVDGINAVRLAGRLQELPADREALGTCRFELIAGVSDRCEEASATAPMVWREAMDKPPPLKVLVRWDRRHTGLVADVEGGARLAELTPTEATAVHAISNGVCKTAGDTCDASRWDLGIVA